MSPESGYYGLTNSGASWTPSSLVGLSVDPNIAQNQIFTINGNNDKTFSFDTGGIDLNGVAAINGTNGGVYQFNQVKVLGKARAKCDDRMVIDSELLIDGSSLTVSDRTAGSITLINGGTLVP